MLALLRKEIAWGDAQAMTLDQALLVLCGDNADKNDAAEQLVDAMIEYLQGVAKAAGLTMPEMGKLGAVEIAKLAKLHTGKAVRPDHIYPLLEEDEFNS